MQFLKKIFERKKSNTDSNEIDSFKYRFNNYLDLLNNNYNSLKIISDLEEKSQGEYVFDINFINSSYSRLYLLINNLANNLIVLAGNKYKPIIEQIKLIDSNIQKILSPEVNIKHNLYTIHFYDISVEMNSSVGNKSANLCEIRNQLRLPVPNGFAITAWAYLNFLEYNDIQSRISDIIKNCNIKSITALESISNEIQLIIENSNLPQEIEDAIVQSYEQLINNHNKLVSIRSSSIGEDAYYSFAGQYSTFLGVKKENLIESYKKVLASKFNTNAIYYLLSHNLYEKDMLMSVSCIEMVNSRSSGVIYTKNPISFNDDNILISSIWGQGKLLVDGDVNPDSIIYSKKEKVIIEKNINNKYQQLLLNEKGGVSLKSVNEEKANVCSITDEEIIKLAEYSMQIENYYGHPQDIEWAIDFDGHIFILQSRPLRVSMPSTNNSLPDMSQAKIISHAGLCASPGGAIGKIHRIDNIDDLRSIPDNSVIVANNPFPGLITILDKAKAIITQVGGIASHFVTIAREYRVPTIVGMNDISLLENNIHVTVDATNSIVYFGEYPELVDALKPEFEFFEDNQVYRTLKKILKLISPLNLIYPNSPEFQIKNCSTYHDIIRFAHQKAIDEMFNTLDYTQNDSFKAIPLKSNIPLKVFVIRIDQEINEIKKKTLTKDTLDSVPLESFWNGLLEIGWTLPYTSANIKGFMSVMGTELTKQNLSKLSEKSYAVVTKDYMLLSLRMGYHYSTIEAMCSDFASKNFVKMQFKEGGASIDRRLRRIALLKRLLIELGFEVSTKQDYLECSINSLDFEKSKIQLYNLGKITMLTKQLDIALNDDDALEEQFNILKNNLLIQ